MRTRTADNSFTITKKQVYEAYKAVKSNAGSAGVDGQTITQFEADLRGNLYKLRNRMMLDPLKILKPATVLRWHQQSGDAIAKLAALKKSLRAGSKAIS
jgi:hypothetical protein